MTDRIRIRGEWRDEPSWQTLAHALLALAVSRAEQTTQMPVKREPKDEVGPPELSR